MISVIRVCARCGAKISSDATREVCPACLLESGLDLPDANYTNSHEVSNAQVRKALSDFGDYELLEEIGRGGQAVVYRAHQKSLNRTVALKVIGLGPWTTETHLKRFRREAEAAAHLEHPSIVPIYEVGERDGQCYFSMKFVEGGQLDEVVKQNPLSIRQAAELIAKVARTVHYAHEHGILHRDIKPGNILLDQNGEPHLTDFGLARLVEAESTVTATLDVLGTPSYMAPEQASGGTTKVSKATDVYGLGAVLYQLLTGHPPFAGGTTYDTIKLLIDTEPRRPRSLNSKIDRELSTICLKCLEKDPRRRYASALALAEDLKHWLKHEPIQARRTGLVVRSKKWVQRNPALAALVVLSLVLSAGLGGIVWNRRPAVIIPKSVAVLPFENLSEDTNSAYFAEGIQEEILTRLASIADLKVISRASTQRYQSKPTNLGEIAKQLGVANILEGSVQRAADQVRVNVQLINAQTDSHLWAETFDRKRTDIFSVESEVARAIADQLRAKLTAQEEQVIAAKPTNNPDAYDAYLRGLAFQARTAFDDDALQKAIDSYERAVQFDPNLALAWAQLSRAHTRFYLHGTDSFGTRRDAARKGVENAQKLGPDLPETLFALGYYQYGILRDYEAAKTTFGRVVKTLPGSSEVPLALGQVTQREGHWNESIAYFEQALALDPRNTELLSLTAWSYGMRRQFPAALKLCDRVLDIVPNDPDMMAFKAGIYLAQGNLEEAAKLSTEVNAKTPSSIAFGVKIAQLRLGRNYAEAVRLLQARQTGFNFPTKIDKLFGQVTLSMLQRLAGDTAGAKIAAEEARNALELLCKNEPSNYLNAAALSQAYTVLGEENSALTEAERAITLLPSAKDRVDGPAFEENLALIQTIFGESGSAISTLTRLLQTPYDALDYYSRPITPALLKLDPFWDSLRADPAFQKLCQEKVDRSIAVLPFENLSGDPSNAYFADGIQEEILTRLVKIGDLKVISRTSTSRYKSKPDDIAEIAKQLGVANILEGSVQKVANQVRVNVQLIDAQTDSHLWADTYDRKLTDILSVESEMAKRIAESLQAKLTGQEEKALAAKPTTNPEAYDAYLRGLTSEERWSISSGEPRGSIWKAAGFYEQAVHLDPNFAVAWARLSRVDSVIYPMPIDTNATAQAARREAAKRALDNAQRLEPNSPETLLALGYYQCRVLRDYRAAKTTFERVSQVLPGSSEVPFALGQVAGWQGHWDESISYLEQALTLDPRNVSLLLYAAWKYITLRQFPAALKLYDRALDIMPNDPEVMANKASIYQAQGRLPEAARLLSTINEETPNESIFQIQITRLRLERNYGEAIRLLQARLARFRYDDQGDKGWDQAALVILQLLAGDTPGVRVTAEQARNTLEPLYGEEGHDVRVALLSAWLSQVYAAIGEKGLALKAAERTVAVYSRATDPSADDGKENLALIWTIFGENGSAISILTPLLQTPYNGFFYNPTPITSALLRLDPIWDPLRGDPTFQKLCEEKQPPATP